MNRKIAVIGAGQLGSRHLQGLAKIAEALDIFIVDPSEASTTVALERFDAVNTGNGTTVTALRTIEALPAELDVVIIATAAHVRFGVLERLLAHAKVDKLLLEKVLFQELAQYEAASSLLGSLRESTWVNCAQRLWPFFIALREQFRNDPNLEVVITGSNWGLGCNAVHNTDIAEFLWDGKKTQVARLDPVVIESKRPGFKEFTGELVTEVEGGGRLRQLSYATGDAPFTVTVFHPQLQQRWNVVTSQLYSADAANGWSVQASDMAAPFQSQLTATIVQSMLDGADCGLPAFDEAAATHVATLSALLSGAKANGSDFGAMCPVT
jgi:hypothetical protein